MKQCEVLLIGGRAGVGKTTVGWEISAQLRTAKVAHVVLEGDFLGHVHPAPEGDPHRSAIVERNLASIWGNYEELGYRRLIYTHTASVLPEAATMFKRVMGTEPRLVRVLLTASDTTAHERLAGRELGSELEKERERSAYKARLLDEHAPADTVRVMTDGRSVLQIASEVLATTGWTLPDARQKSVAQTHVLPSP
ncbi:hypothetical protein Q5762_14325 [Streptomyces sp. P9(2023)]|uniref:hypothetical protein n=1 Tax=Streptomyces sp. P9(2023) TaxID=3064394 RepID=UPI0028F43484|nr:hypothetical protein [Streptomyces sp. P9(2023)]MDT9689492.1 hypothetical protein [Streptomyces sp. P9(2023)]